MRLARLDLTRYGHFTDASVVLPRSDCDLHLIVGENEAGKSTIRQAILDLFYGIAKSSPYGFKHGLPEMELAGIVEDRAASLAFRRLKKNRNPLVDADGNPLPDGALLGYIGHADAAFYARMFGLDQATLVAGAQELLDSKGDVGQMLFQAAAGVTGLHRLREQLEEDARALWGERKRGDAVFYIAQQQLHEADARLKEVGVTAAKWQTAKRELDAAVAASDSARALYDERDREQQRLERVRRVFSPLAKRREAQAELAQLGASPRLAPTAGATLNQASSEISEAAAALDLMQRRLGSETEALAKLVIDAAVLDHKPEIENLVERISGYLKAVGDLPQVRTEMDTHAGAARALAAQIGWSETEVDAIAAGLPSRTARSELQSLLLQKEPVALAATRIAADHKALAEAIATLAQKITAAPPHAPIPVVTAALRQARALDVAGRTDSARQKLLQAEVRLDAALRRLAPWTGNEQDLRALKLPDTAELQDLAAARAGLVARRDHAAETLRHKEVDAARAKAHADAHDRAHRPVTLEALSTSRADRDALWREIRVGERAPNAAGNDYEQRVVASDRLADQRYVDADRIAEATRLGAAHEGVVAEIEVLQGQRDDATTQLATFDDAWARRTAVLGLALSIGQFPDWLRSREHALACAQALAEARVEEANLVATARECAQALREALQGTGMDGIEGVALDGLIVRVEVFEDEQAATRARIKAWREQLEQAELDLPTLIRKDESAAAALATWQTTWQGQLAACGLDAALTSAAAGGALEIFTRIDEACRHVRDHAAPRVRLMQEEIDRFETSARTIAASCAAGLAGLPATEITAKLREALRGAERTQSLRVQAEANVTATRRDLAAAEAALVTAQARIRPLLEAAGADSIDALRLAISAAERYREVEQRIAAAETVARNGGDNIPLATLQAEVDATDPTRIETLLREARLARDAADRERETCIGRLTTAKAAFDRIAGQDEAARAASQRQDALLAMGDAVDEYVRITVGTRLLKWAVDRYSEEKQQPLLKRASDLFGQLTRGRYVKLSVNFEANPPELIAHRDDGSLVRIGGLSTGAESQLYLALRLAALELHLESAVPLPFIADDLFVDWDDKRAGAGFGVLADLATRTQVIMLAHHHHLIDVARKHTGERVNVIQLADS